MTTFGFGSSCGSIFSVITTCVSLVSFLRVSFCSVVSFFCFTSFSFFSVSPFILTSLPAFSFTISSGVCPSFALFCKSFLVLSISFLVFSIFSSNPSLVFFKLSSASSISDLFFWSCLSASPESTVPITSFANPSTIGDIILNNVSNIGPAIFQNPFNTFITLSKNFIILGKLLIRNPAMIATIAVIILKPPFFAISLILPPAPPFFLPTSSSFFSSSFAFCL